MPSSDWSLNSLHHPSSCGSLELSTIFACDELQMIHTRGHGHGCIGLASSQGKWVHFCPTTAGWMQDNSLSCVLYYNYFQDATVILYKVQVYYHGQQYFWNLVLVGVVLAERWFNSIHVASSRKVCLSKIHNSRGQAKRCHWSGKWSWNVCRFIVWPHCPVHAQISCCLPDWW